MFVAKRQHILLNNHQMRHTFYPSPARSNRLLLPLPTTSSLPLLLFATLLAASSQQQEQPQSSSCRSSAPNQPVFSSVQCSTLPHHWNHGEGGMHTRIKSLLYCNVSHLQNIAQRNL
jgi:hypothetical protein